MKIQAMHQNFQMPTRGSEHAGGYDIYMPEEGFVCDSTNPVKVGLGFAAEVPVGHVAFILPRSSAGSQGLELMNTCGVIDADYRGQWFAKLNLKLGGGSPGEASGVLAWQAGDRLLQFVIVPVLTPELELVESVVATARGTGGFGSTGS